MKQFTMKAFWFCLSLLIAYPVSVHANYNETETPHIGDMESLSDAAPSTWSQSSKNSAKQALSPCNNFKVKSFTDDEVFTASTKEGEILTYKVISSQEMTCQVGDGSVGTVSSFAQSITIPDNVFGYKVIAIGINAFYGCSALTSITIPESVTTIWYNAFYGCSSLTSITIPEGVTEIHESTFFGCSSLTSINIPNGVTRIGMWAFEGCNSLQSINIPKNVRIIGDRSFSDCGNLTSITVAAGNPYFDSRNGCNAIIKTASNTIIAGCKKTLIPDGVTTIGFCAFSGCSGLTSINIPAGVTSIESAAFESCSSLSTINIPASVTTIDIMAFQNCSSLTSINIPASVTSITDQMFNGCSSLISINIPAGVTTIGSYAFGNCSSLTSINIPARVTSIGAGAFQNCSSLTSISIPAGVMSIGLFPFYGCNGLETIVVEDGNMNYDSRNACNAIIETASNTLIAGCQNTIIPDDCISIGYAAFAGLESLTAIIIPNQVTKIGDNAFYLCASLKEVYCYAEQVPATDAKAFNGFSPNSATLYVPANAIEAYKSTAPWKDFGTIKSIKPVAVQNVEESEVKRPNDAYFLDGRRLTTPQRGLNLLRMSNGTVRKVMIR